MKKIIKSGILATVISLPVLATLLFASSDCATEFTGTCMQVSINDGEKFPVCFEHAIDVRDEC